MRVVLPRLLSILAVAAALAASPLGAQAPDTFRWIDFHAQADQDIVIWINRSLTVANWSAIREIGVEYDAALVITTERATPQSAPNTDTFTIWSASLTDHSITALLKGVNLRLVDWVELSDGSPRELGAVYENCTGCEASTFFTAFHYSAAQHAWSARWMRGDHAAPVWSANSPAEMTQVYGVLSEPGGRQFLASWRHFDYGKQKPEDNFVYVYDADPATGLDRTDLLKGAQAEAIEQRLCQVQNAMPGTARGQDSALCQPAAALRQGRRPVTTPPANNRGHSAPPGAAHN